MANMTVPKHLPKTLPWDVDALLQRQEIDWTPAHYRFVESLSIRTWRKRQLKRTARIAKEMAEQDERQRQADLAAALARQQQFDAEASAERMKEKHRLEAEADRADYLKTIEGYVAAVKKKLRLKQRRDIKKRKRAQRNRHTVSTSRRPQ